MKQVRQFLLILCVTLLIVSAASHAAVRWLKLKVTPCFYRVFGPDGAKPVAVVFGSSPAFDGLDWGQISLALGGGVENWGIFSSSPSEWEIMQRRSPSMTHTFIGISPLDEDEYLLCDFRADIVPFREALAQTFDAGLDWQYRKRVLSQYPLNLARKIFPTAGRADGVLVGVRRQLQQLTGHSLGVDAGAAPLFGGMGANNVQDKVSDWTPARIQRRIAIMETSCGGRHSFHGPKRQALIRMLQQASRQGRVTLIVLPVSPIYEKQFLTPKVMRDFEASITELTAMFPDLNTVRLDALPQLNLDDVYYDFVHMNGAGARIATAALLAQLQSSASNSLPANAHRR